MTWFRNISLSERAQSTTILLAFGLVLIIGATAVVIIFFSGFNGAPDSVSKQDTPILTVTPTLTESGTPTVDRTVATTNTSTKTPPMVSTSTSTSKHTPIPTHTSTTTSTVTPEVLPFEPYKVFLTSFINQIELKSEVPVEFRGQRIATDETLKTVFDFSDESGQQLKEQNGVLSAYSQTLLFYNQGKLSGESTHGLRVYEINSSDGPPKTFYISNSTAQKFGSGQINVVEFHNRVYNTSQNMTTSEQSLAQHIAQSTENGTLK